MILFIYPVQFVVEKFFAYILPFYDGHKTIICSKDLITGNDLITDNEKEINVVSHITGH